MRLSKILLPIDFSERSTGAAHYAQALACRFQSELTIAHVFEPDPTTATTRAARPLEWYEACRVQTRRMLENFQPGESRGLPIRRVLLEEGDIACAIVRLAHSEQMDLIVMPTHGYGVMRRAPGGGRFRRFIIGSVTAKVLHDADCPVLTGGHIQEAPPVEPILFRNIVCAIDFDPAGEKAMRWAVEFAAEFHARLTLVHALPLIDADQAPNFDQALPMMLERSAREKASELQNQLGTKADEIFESGPVAGVVRNAATSQHAALVVIARHESPGSLGRLRTNAYAIVRESPCPVVSI